MEEAGEIRSFRSSPTDVTGRPDTLLLLTRSGFHFRQNLIECRTIKQPAVRDNDADLLGVPDVFERVCSQQH